MGGLIGSGLALGKNVCIVLTLDLYNLFERNLH